MDLSNSQSLLKAWTYGCLAWFSGTTGTTRNVYNANGRGVRALNDVIGQDRLALNDAIGQGRRALNYVIGQGHRALNYVIGQ